MNLTVIFVSQNLFYTGKIQNHFFEFNPHSSFQESQRSKPNLASNISDVPSKPKFVQAAFEKERKDPYSLLFLDFHPNSPEFAKVHGNSFTYDIRIKSPQYILNFIDIYFLLTVSAKLVQPELRHVRKTNLTYLINQCIDQCNLLSNFDKILRSNHHQTLLKLLISTAKQI